MSFPIRRLLAESQGQRVPEVPQVLRPVEMSAGESLAGLRREVGGPRRPLRGASGEACRRLEAVVNGLDLRGMFAKQEALIETTAGPDGLAYAGYRNGEETDHWWVGGDLDHAFRGAAPGVITLLVGAGNLRGRRRPVAQTAESPVALELLASERFLMSMNEPISSVGFGPQGHLLGMRESLWLLAGSVAKLVRALPVNGPAVRILFRFPAEEHWLPLLPALHENLASPELCTNWFARTRRNRGLFEKAFTAILDEMLGEDRHRVQVVAHDALHHVGNRLEAAVARGEKPMVSDLHSELRETDELWKFVLYSHVQEAVRRELVAERRFALEEPLRLDGLAGLVNAADVVDLLKYGSDGLAIVVDEANAARRLLGVAERIARRHPDGAARMAAIGPLSKVLGGAPGPHGPFAPFQGDIAHMVVLDPDEPSRGELVPTGDLFRQLYSVR
ncbi:hypothetical protein [Actinomadura mexicana]|uniref:Uncharacterized protein n=1 Tax=Actinomadura mexicana TaxID=134959 RepID=A0A238WYA1_9ACTN|nr:hypothetical protein [Actinomadura mexicana]SNR51184.1 hypothetical protein SAMN06265355_103430 [Actinomadura mexicana]